MQRCHRPRLGRALAGQLIISVLLVQLGRAAAAALGRVFASLWGGGPDRSTRRELVPGRYGLVPMVAAGAGGAADRAEAEGKAGPPAEAVPG